MSFAAFRLACIVLPLSLLLSSCRSTSDVYGNKPGPRGFRTVIVDAGHGGRDSGAKNRKQMEKHLALDLSQRLKRELQPGFKVVLLRSEDQFIDLDDRVSLANQHPSAILLSIHLNSGPRRLAGPETYYWRVDSHSLATRLQRNLAAAAPNENGNRGLVRRRLRLTRNPRIPCVLVECGYLSNARESALLGTEAYRARLAKALADAIREQSRHGDDGMGPLPPPIFAPPSKGTDARDRF